MGSIPSKPRRANWLWFTRGISASPCRSSITYNYCIYIFLIYMQEDFGFHLSKDGLGPATTPRSRSAWTNLFNEIWRGGSLLLFFRISREHTRRGLGEFRLLWQRASTKLFFLATWAKTPRFVLLRAVPWSRIFRWRRPIASRTRPATGSTAPNGTTLSPSSARRRLSAIM